VCTTGHTDNKETQIFLINKEIQSGAVAKSRMTNSLLIYGEIFAHFLIYWEPFLTYDLATAPLNFLIYEENLFFFLSVQGTPQKYSIFNWSDLSYIAYGYVAKRRTV
jgi:hypothetical protein